MQGAPKKAAQTEVRAETTDEGGGDKLEVWHVIGAAQGENSKTTNSDKFASDNNI